MEGIFLMGQIERTPPRDGVAIRSHCPACGQVDLPIRNVHLWLEHRGPSSYTFICPSCSGLVRKHADAGTVGLLLASSPPLGHEDLQDFKQELARGDWFHRFDQRFGRALGVTRKNRKRGLPQRWFGAPRFLKQVGQRHRLLSS
jgi:hypothetical protein